MSQAAWSLFFVVVVVQMMGNKGQNYGPDVLDRRKGKCLKVVCGYISRFWCRIKCEIKEDKNDGHSMYK